MIAVTTWTCKLAAWLSTPGTRVTENHVCLDVPTKWSRSVPRKVAPQVTMTGGWPTAGDRHGRVRVDLSLLLVRSAAPVARTGWGPPGAPWSCEMNAAATSPCDLLRAGACAWWLSCCSAIRSDSLHAPQEHPWRSGPLSWVSRSTLGGKSRPLWGLGDLTGPHTHRGRGGGPTP